MDDNIVKFPAVTVHANPEEALEAAKGWDFEQVVIIGMTKEPSETIIVTADNQDKRFYLEMAELLRVMYLQFKGWL